MKLEIARLTICWLLCLSLTASAFAQGGPGRGRGMGRGAGGGPGAGGSPGAGGGPGAGHGHDERHDEDQQLFHFLLENHEKIVRKVTELPNGVETLTESDDNEIADKIKEHVQWMEYRIKETHPIRMRDPLFRELFQHTDKISMKHEDTEKGVRVTETSDDPYVAKLIKAHAEAVSGFVARGFAEAMKNHPVPERDERPAGKASAVAPMKVKDYGKVVRLPDAAQQPRSGTKVLVDVTGAGKADELNPSIERVAKYVNLYHGGGKEPAEAEFAIVLHGDATLAVLNDEAYAKRFGTSGNPNLACLHQLHEAGVEIYVCGQSLLKEDASPDDVVVFADTAVSALTAVVNLQADGYAYVPLGK